MPTDPTDRPTAITAAPTSDGAPAVNSAANPDLDVLLSTSIDAFPADMYSVSECRSLIRQPPGLDPTVDGDVTMLQLDDIVKTASVIVRARIVAVREPSVFTPDGLPREHLDATGASDPSDLALSATPFDLEVTDSIHGEASAGAVLSGLFLGCWSAGSIALLRPEAEVLIFGFAPDPSGGVSQLTRTELRVFEWFEVGDEGYLTQGSSVAQLPGRFRLVDGRQVDEVAAELRSAAGQ